MKTTTMRIIRRCISVNTAVAIVFSRRADVTAINTTVGNVSQTTSARRVAVSRYLRYKTEHITRQPSFNSWTLYEQHVFLQVLFKNLYLVG